MTTDEFLRIIRGDGDKLRVDDVVIRAGDQEIRGKGTLRITGDEFEAEIAIENPEQLPEMRSGIYTKRDSWTMSGVIEDQLSFDVITWDQLHLDLYRGRPELPAVGFI